MKYMMFEFEDEKFWIEIDNQGYAIRQIIIDSNNCAQVSCFEDCLAEGEIKEDELDASVNWVTSDEFEKVWDKHTLENRTKWDECKQHASIGKEIQGEVLYHYPQGWIMRTGNMLCVCDSDLNLITRQIVKGKITGYDEINMWLVIEDIIV